MKSAEQARGKMDLTEKVQGKQEKTLQLKSHAITL